jgi:dTDP-4-amino-4,6-dideoxygalactose transaminase
MGLELMAPRQVLPAMAGGAPVREEFLVFGAPLIGEAEIAEVVDTLRSGWIGFGPKCLRLEREFAGYVGAAQAVSLGSCTAGLHLALVVAGVGPGDEVITTPLTFAATANVIEHVGARPVFVDVEEASQNISPSAIEAAITPRTKAIIPVHMAGRPCDMDAIGALAERHGLTVIEDAAHAVEGAWNGRKIGSISRFTVFSFYATKNLTTAEGGMLTTADAAGAERIRTLRLHGISKDAWKRYSAAGFTPYETIEPGYKYNLTDLQASLGLHQLARIEENLGVRERLWRFYDAAFADLEAVETPAPCAPEERHARHLYTLLLRPQRLRIDRQRFIEALQAENIGAGIHFVPVHLHAYYREKYGYRPGDFPQAEQVGARTVSLPLSAKLTERDAQDVADAVRKVVNYYGR